MEHLVCVSIIVPVYNASKYLCRCIDSILNQTLSDFELILIDDGSNDNSLNICREYADKDKRIILLSCENGGPSKARNLGLEHVRGKWITFVDSDDYVTPDYLHNFFKYNSSDIEAQVVQGYFTMGYNGEEDSTLYPSTKYESHIIREGKRSVYMETNNLLYNWAVWCKIFSTEIIQKNNLRFEEELWCGEDGLFWHKYLCHIKTIIYIPEQGYFYFCPKDFDSISRNGKHQLSTQGYIITSKNYKYISTELQKKFKIGYKYASFLKMFYIKNYFKAVLATEKLSADEMSVLKDIKPRKGYIIPTKKGILFWIANLIPAKLLKYIYTRIKR